MRNRRLDRGDGERRGETTVPVPRAEFHGFIWRKQAHEGSLSIAFQEVPDPTPGKNKLHIDAYYDDPEAVSEPVSGLGGSLVASDEVPGFVWNIYSDPEGNQFCIGPGVESG